MSFGRTVHFNVKIGRVDEFNRLMQGEVMPLLKKEKAFREQITLLHGNNGLSVTLWDDRAGAEMYESKTYPEVLKKLLPVFDGAPRVDTYESISTTIPEVVRA